MNLSDRLRHIVRRVYPVTDGEPDHLLLARFARTRDEAAFAELVRRHGPMVLGVCRRTLRNEHDAEDAFQAAFLVLARRAGSVRLTGSVGDWLFGVARRTSLAALRASARRSAREARVPAKNDSPADLWELRAVLDEELSRLPERYRAVLVLTDLEGKDRRQVAAELMVPEGTVASRLSRGRAMLAARLTRRGWGPAAVGGTVSVPAALEAATVGAAVGREVRAGVSSLAERVVMEMTRKKLAVVTVVAVVVVGGGLAGLTAAGPGSGSPTSGPAEFSVSHAGGTTLLLNPATGDTWVLNQPAGGQPTWVPVKRAEQTSPTPTPAPAKAAGEKPQSALELAGLLKPVRSATVHPPWPGVLARMSVKVGDSVKAGQVMGALDDTQARLAVEAAEADLAKAKAAIGPGKGDAFVQMEVMKAEAEVRRAEVGVKQAQLRLKEAQLLAPFDGTVLEVNAAAGDVVRPDGIPIVQMATLRELDAAVDVPERDVAKVSVGQGCVVRLSGDGAEYPAVVHRVGAVVDPATATVAVRARVRLPEGGVPPRAGSFVVVRFAGKK